MTTEMTPELLRRAAKLMREGARAATPGPWEVPYDRSRFITTAAPIAVDEADWGAEGHDTLAIGTLQDTRAWRYADVRHIAGMDPTVALAVADLLDHEARAPGYSQMPDDHPDAVLARTYLGEAS